MSGFGFGERITLSVPEDRHLVLRQLVVADAEPYFNLIAANPGHVSQFGETIAAQYPSVESVRQHILDPYTVANLLHCGIWHRENDRSRHTMVGSIDLMPMGQHGEAVIGWWVGAEHTGNGYAARAVRPLARFVFAHMGIEKVYAEIHKDNQASLRTAENAGFFELTNLKQDDMLTYALRKDIYEL